MRLYNWGLHVKDRTVYMIDYFGTQGYRLSDAVAARYWRVD